MDNLRLLIAEDDPKLLKTLVHLFRINNYAVDAVNNGNDAFEYAQSAEYDGLVFDIMMPGMDGITVLTKLRQCGITTPALFLTAKTELYQKVEGLDAGADDYLPKPFSTVELMARVRAMLRRRDNFIPTIIEFGKLKLNCSTFELCYEDNTQSLNGKEFLVMETLMQKSGVVVTAEQLITHVWGWDTNVDIGVVWVHVSNIRKKLAIINAPIEIKYIRSVGYVLEEKT